MHLISEAHGNQQRNKLECQTVGVIIPQLNGKVWAHSATVIDSPTTPVLLPNAGEGAFRRIKESLESLHMFILTKMKDARQLPDTLLPQLKRDELLTAQHCTEPEWQESGQNKEKDFQRQLKLLPSGENKTEARLQRAAFEKPFPHQENWLRNFLFF